jgi:hypothetical protein
VEIQHYLQAKEMTFLLFIGEMFRRATKSIAKHRWAFTILLCGTVAVGGAVFLKGCYVDHEINKTGSSVTNTKVEEGKTADNSAVASGNADRSTKDAQTASNTSKTAIQRARDARNANVKNVSADELHQAHCRAYPEDCQ